MNTQTIAAEAVLPVNGKCCPNCGFILPKARVKDGITPQERKEARLTAKDVEKCKAAILVLQNRITMRSERYCKEAHLSEILRLSIALESATSNPYLLKRIFRRKET